MSWDKQMGKRGDCKCDSRVEIICLPVPFALTFMLPLNGPFIGLLDLTTTKMQLSEVLPLLPSSPSEQLMPSGEFCIVPQMLVTKNVLCMCIYIYICVYMCIYFDFRLLFPLGAPLSRLPTDRTEWLCL